MGDKDKPSVTDDPVKFLGGAVVIGLLAGFIACLVWYVLFG
jgi:hypothetical protein